MNSVPRLRRIVKVSVFIFTVWGMYRLVLRLPDVIEETILKPLLFVGSVLLVEKPKRIVRFFLDVWGRGNWFRAILFGLIAGLGYGALYALASVLTFGKLTLASSTAHQFWVSYVGLGVLTAIWEEWAIVGYLFRELRRVTKSSLLPRLVVAAFFSLIHLPILLFWYQFTGSTVVFQLLIFAVLGFNNAMLMEFTGNLIAPILAHTLWGISLVLYQ